MSLLDIVMELSLLDFVMYIGPVKQNNLAYNCDYFLIHQLKHVFWVLKRTISSRRFF